MIAGLSSVAARCRVAAALLLALVAGPALAFDLPGLMASLAEQRSGAAEFSEQRFVKGLDEPLTASGTLSFAAPDRFVRKTLKPRAETLAVDGNTVTLTRAGRNRSFTLDAAPDMVAIVEALRGTLTGNLQAMQRYFKTELAGSAEQWTLALTPLEAGLAGQVRSIRLGGHGAELGTIEMLLADGDRSVMTISPRPAGRFGSAVTGPAAIGARHRRALVLWVLAMLAGAALIARTPFSADLSAFLPANPNAQQRVLTEQLQNGVAARTLLAGIEGGDASRRAAASRSLAAAMRSSGLFDQVQNGEAGDWQATGDWLLRHRYQLSPAVTPEHFTVAGLREAIGETLSLLGTPAGSALKPLLERDPTGEIRLIAESLLPANAPRSEQGVWVSRAAPRAVLLATTRAAGADLDGQQRALELIREAFAPQAASGLRLALSGAPVFGVESRRRIEHEVKLLGGVGLLLIGGLLLLAFGSVRALAAGMLPVATGIVAGVAAVGLAFGTVHGLTLAFGSTLIGEAVDYAIYYLIQARGGGWRAWRRDNWPTVRLGLCTSVCGFAALLFSGFPGLAQLGLFSIAGLAGAAAATRFVLPALMPDGAKGEGLRRPLASAAEQAVRRLPRLRRPALLLGLTAASLVTMQGGHLWRGSLGSLSPVPQAAQDLDASLRADLGASDARTLVVASGADVETTLRAAEAAAARLDPLVEQGLLAGYDSPTRFLPSQATQRARGAALPALPVLRERLAEATRGGPLKAKRLEPFVTEADAARRLAPIDRAQLAGSPLAPVVDALLFPRRAGGWSALLPLQPANGDLDTAAVRAALKGLPAHAQIQIVDIKHELDTLYAHYLGEALTQAMLGALAVVAVLALHLRSSRRLFAVCAPLALSVLLTLGGLALFDVALGILHLVGLLLVIAVGSNYGLFFDQLQRDGRADADTLASLLLANLTTVTSFGLIALSDIPALSAIGRVVAPGALLALLLSGVLSGALPRRPRAS